MKILVIDVNFDYKNIMYRQFYSNLTMDLDVRFFGPGYVDVDTLDMGVNKYIEKCGPFDAILLGTYFIYSAFPDEGMRQNTYFVHRNVIPYYRVSDAYFFCSKLLNEIETIANIPAKILVYYEDNSYMSNEEKKLCQKFLENGWYMLTWPREIMHYFDNAFLEKHCGLTNNCISLYENYGEMMIPISLHAISVHELFYRYYGDREYDWCVPGNRESSFYPNRQKIFELIKKAGLKVWTKDPYQNVSVSSIDREHILNYDFRTSNDRKFSRIFGKDVFISSYPNSDIIGATREVYLESMRKTKCIYADGSVTNTILRKHFETCACGGLLVTSNVDGLSAMGFVDGINCRVISQENIEKSINSILLDNNEMIAEKGQRHIIEKHMFRNRTKALVDVVKKICNGDYRGSFWEDGDMIIK